MWEGRRNGRREKGGREEVGTEKEKWSGEVGVYESGRGRRGRE